MNHHDSSPYIHARVFGQSTPGSLTQYGKQGEGAHGPEEGEGGVDFEAHSMTPHSATGGGVGAWLSGFSVSTLVSMQQNGKIGKSKNKCNINQNRFISQYMLRIL